MLKEQIDKIRNRHEKIVQGERGNIAFVLAAHITEGITWPVCDFVNKLRSDINDAIVKRIMQVLDEKY